MCNSLYKIKAYKAQGKTLYDSLKIILLVPATKSLDIFMFLISAKDKKLATPTFKLLRKFHATR